MAVPLIHLSPLADVEIPEVPVTELVLRHAIDLSDKPALIDGSTGRALTYGALAATVRSLAGGLAARGFGRGQVLALTAPNVREYAVVFQGTAMAGGTRVASPGIASGPTTLVASVAGRIRGNERARATRHETRTANTRNVADLTTHG